jgi:hypothetical protein
MQVTINAITQRNNVTDGNKGDITVSLEGTLWTINPAQLANKFVYAEIPAGIVNGINPVFTSINSFIPATLIVYVNGLRQTIINDYITAGNNTITFVSPPLITDITTIDYIKL